MSSTSERDLIGLVNGNDRAKIVASGGTSLSSASLTATRKIAERISIGPDSISINPDRFLEKKIGRQSGVRQKARRQESAPPQWLS
jgi:hypothetical protein